MERWVGVLTPLTKGAEPDVIFDGAVAYARNVQWHVPEWLTRELVRRVHERVRARVGRWRATRFGEVMILERPGEVVGSTMADSRTCGVP